MTMIKQLNVAEHFYSVQAECVTTGHPAYFIRLKGCNLSCGFTGQHISNILKAGRNNTTAGDIVGDLHAENKATWTCDTAPIWLFGDKMSFDDMINSWKQQNIYDWIMSGRVHIIWTGGEPTIPKHQEDIVNFLDYAYDHGKTNSLLPTFYNEIETNGTFVISNDLLSRLQQINCSVKLENSGMPKEKRIVHDALKSIQSHINHYFKFVISSEDDIKEIENDFIKPFDIEPNRVVLMPGLDSQANFHERTRFSLEMAKKYGYIGLTRLHVSAWDKTVSV